MKGRHQRAPVLSHGPVFRFLEEVAHRRYFLCAVRFFRETGSGKHEYQTRVSRPGPVYRYSHAGSMSSNPAGFLRKVPIDAGIVAPRKAQFDQLPLWLESLHPVLNGGHLRELRFGT